jgi:hypothetical protein
VRINCYDYRNVREVTDWEVAFAWRKRPINILQVSLSRLVDEGVGGEYC